MNTDLPGSNGVALASVDAMRERIRSKSRLKGRALDAASALEVRALVGDAPLRRDLLLEYLHQLNDAFGCLRERHLAALAAQMGLAQVEVYEVASFYAHFERVKGDAAVPAVTLRVCQGLSCQMAGSADLAERMRALLGGVDVRLVPVPCVGRCEQAPVAMLGQSAVPQATPAQLLALLQAPQASAQEALGVANFNPAEYAERSVTQIDEAKGAVPDHTGYASYRANGGYALIADLHSGAIASDVVLGAMEESGLRGLGGAGFPAARKWRIVRSQSAPRLMAVNIDEGEPGTFKDRTYLERDPHRFLEGMLIAAQVVGISHCYIYLRDEYHACRALLQAELAALRAAAPFPLPTIELRRGAGAYICGEESAMIESLEGKRGQPRLRPPYIAEVGLFGRPTLEHNFETLYWVRDIVQRGPQWFGGFGRRGRKGLRSFSVSGRVKHPGVKLAPAGISLRELVAQYCGGMQDGHQLYAYLPGGASGGILPERLADVALDFDTLQPYGCFIGSAAIIVLSQHDRVRDAALAMMEFFAHESCGQCTPCRVGTAKAAQLMRAPQWDQSTLQDLCTVMADASICGLGQAAPNPVRCVLQYFAHEIGPVP